MQEQKDMIVNRQYQKADRMLMLVVRKISGGNLDGFMYQFETWLNAQEIAHERVTSGDRYFVRNAYQAKLRDLQEENWSKRNAGHVGGEDAKFFDPESL